MLLAGLAYFALAVGSLALWAVGFDPYCGYGIFLGRPLLLWGAVAYACMAALCFGGVRRQYALAGATFLAVVHASFLILAWRAFGYLCPACAVFLCIEVILAGLLVFALIKRRYSVLLSLAGAFLLVSVILLAYNPSVFGHVLPDGGVPEGVPAVADDKPTAFEEVTASDGRMPGKLPAVERHLDGAAVTHTREANPRATLAPAAAGDPAAAVPDKASSGEQEKEAPPAVRKPLVAVMTANGQQAELDVLRRPVLYFTWWCPACREVLREVGRLPKEKRPYLVAVCYTGIDISRSVGKLVEAGLSDMELYISRESPGDAFPALLLVEGGKERTVSGKDAVLREVGKGGLQGK